MINNENDSFFETLKEEKEVKMELSFDDFMTKVEGNQPKVIEKSKTKKFLSRFSKILPFFRLFKV